MPYSVSKAHGDHGLGLLDHQRVAPSVEHAPHEDPEDPVAVFDLRALHPALEHDDLLTQGDVLKSEPRSISDQCVDKGEKVGEPGHLAIVTRIWRAPRCSA